MDRKKRSASKVTDYRKFHLSGDLDQVVQGKVSDTIKRLENTYEGTNMSEEEATPEQLQEMLREQKQNSDKLQQQVEAMKIRNELEAERLQQAQWELALDQLKQTREHMAQQHDQNRKN